MPSRIASSARKSDQPGPLHRLWLLRGWSRSFERKRLGWHLLVVTPLATACLAYGHPFWGLAVFCLGFWPLPYRAAWTDAGLDVSWLFIRERLNAADIQSVRLRPRPRTFGLFGHDLALDLELTTGTHAILVAPRETLEALHAQIMAPRAVSS